MSRPACLACVLGAVLVLSACSGWPGAGGRAGTTRTPSAPTTASRPSADSPASCHLTGNGVLPDPSCTPGALNRDVTPDAAVLGRTICRPGWTGTVRPSSAESDRLKRQVFRRYGIPVSSDDLARPGYHRVPLEVGGAPRDLANLWPEPWQRDSQHPLGEAPPGSGAQSKDRIEDRVKASVCAGRMTLQDAQHVFLGDWWSQR